MLINISTSSPPYRIPQNIAAEELKKRMAVRPAIARMIDSASHHSGIDARYFVVTDAVHDAKNKFFTNGEGYISPPTKTRMEEYEKWSKKLTADAVGNVLRSAGLQGRGSPSRARAGR